MALAHFISNEASEWTRGLVLAHISQIAYDTNAVRRQRRFAGLGLEEIFSVSGDGTGATGLNAYILTHGDDIVIAFRGSQEGIDWVSNFRFEKVSYAGVLVHNGFAASVARFIRAFNNRLAELGDFNRIWLVGHSLGGATAQLTAYALAGDGYTIANATTFGAPRVGGPRRWVKRVEDRGLEPVFRRWVNDRDLVPRIPFTGAAGLAFVPGIGPVLRGIFSLFFSPRNLAWRHVGRLNYIDLSANEVVLGTDRSLGKPLRSIPGIRFHAISGFAEADEAGYIHSICRFMPDDQRSALEAENEASLEDSVLGLNAITNTENPVALSSFAAILGPTVSLDAVGLHFR